MRLFVFPVYILLLFYVSCEVNALENATFDLTLSPNEYIYTIGSQLDKELLCRTKKPVSFWWMECNSYSEDVWDPKNTYTCDEMYQEPEKYCKNVTKSNDEFSYTNYSPTLSALKLTNFPKSPRDAGCLGCFASDNKNVVKRFINYRFKDCCGTPARRYNSKENTCHRKDDSDICDSTEAEFQKNCKVSPPNNVNVQQTVTDSGDIDIIIRWKKSDIEHKVSEYGNQLTITHDNSESKTRCLITKYDNSTMTSDGYHEYHMGKSMGYFQQQTTYDISINALPFSESVHQVVTTKSASDLCLEYQHKKGKIPSKCYMVHNVTASKCTSDRSVTVTWKRDSSFLDKVNNVTIIYTQSQPILEIPIEKTSHTFLNVTEDFILMIYFKQNDDSQSHYSYAHVTCKFDHHNVTHLNSTINKPADKTMILIQVVIAVLVVSIVIFAIFIYFGMKKVKKDMGRFDRLVSVDSAEGHLIQMKEEEEQRKEYVMIAYPHGCHEVEKIVFFLAAQFNSIGIHVLVDNLQAERVNKEGLSSVLISDFERADYIVVLCTEEKVTEDNPNHRPFKFVMDRLISADYVYKNSHRCIATYFTKSAKYIPAHLMGRSFLLPSSFEKLLLSLLGIQSFAISVYDKMLRMYIGLIDEKKKELAILVHELNQKQHLCCDSSACKKGVKNEDEYFSEISKEEDISTKYIESDNESNIFKSMSTINAYDSRDDLHEYDHTKVDFDETDIDFKDDKQTQVVDVHT